MQLRSSQLPSLHLPLKTTTFTVTSKITTSTNMNTVMHATRTVPAPHLILIDNEHSKNDGSKATFYQSDALQLWEPEQPCRLGFPLSSSATDAWIKGYVNENYDSLAEQLKPDAIEEDDESIDGVLLKDVAMMTVVSLTKALKARGCKSTGKKSVLVERLTRTFDTPTPGANTDGKKGKSKADSRRKPCIANIIGVKEPIEFSSRTEAGEHFGITQAAVFYNITQNLQSNKTIYRGVGDYKVIFSNKPSDESILNSDMSEDMKLRIEKWKLGTTTHLKYEHRRDVTFKTYEFFEANHDNRKMYLANGQPNPEACNQGTYTAKKKRNVVTFDEDEWYLARFGTGSTVNYGWRLTTKSKHKNDTPAQQADHKRKTDGYVVTAQEKNLAERGGKHRYNWSAKTKEKNRFRWIAFLMQRLTPTQLKVRELVRDFQTEEPTIEDEYKSGEDFVDMVEEELVARGIDSLDFEKKMKDYNTTRCRMRPSEKVQFKNVVQLLQRHLPKEIRGKADENSKIVCHTDIEGNLKKVVDMAVIMMGKDLLAAEGGKKVAHKKNKDNSIVTSDQMQELLDKTLAAGLIQLEEEFANLPEDDAMEEEEEEVASMTVSSLKTALKARSLGVSGKKSVLVERLTLSREQDSYGSDSDEDSDEDSEPPKKKAKVQPTIRVLMVHKNGNENRLYTQLLEELDEKYTQVIEMFCMGKAIRFLMNRKPNGAMQDGRPSLYPLDMTSLTYVICNREKFLHLADADSFHQMRVSRAIFRAYAIKHKDALLKFEL